MGWTHPTNTTNLATSSSKPLASVIVQNLEIVNFIDFFRASLELQEFGGVSLNIPNYEPPSIFTGLISMSVNRIINEEHLRIVFPFGQSLRRLDLSSTLLSLTGNGYREILSRRTLLQALKTTTSIGDYGLKAVADNCKMLKRLRVERQHDLDCDVSDHGLMDVAYGCPELEYLSINVSCITSKALEAVGENLVKLNDFRISLLFNQFYVLDTGVLALVKGCTGLRRLTLLLKSEAVTDAGLRFIGQFSHNIKSMLLGYVGETDNGLRALLDGCRRSNKLEKLEIRSVSFSEQAFVDFAEQLPSLRSFWIYDHIKVKGKEPLKELAKKSYLYWNVEVIPPLDPVTPCTPRQRKPSPQIFMYRSLAGPRTDVPHGVTLLPRS